MRQYLALVDREGDSSYGIRFPDIEGCFSAADSADEIIPNAIEALLLWAEDMELPEPADMEDVKSRPEMRAALMEGAFLIAIPLIDNDATVVRANVTFERGILRAIDMAAAKRGLTRSAFLASAARHEIEGAIDVR